MNLKELLERKRNIRQYQLLIMKYGKVEEKSIEREYYIETPIYDKFSGPKKEYQEKYIVLVPFHNPVDIGRNWKYWDITTIVVTTKEELLKHYSLNQLNSWLEWLDEEVRKELI